MRRFRARWLARIMVVTFAALSFSNLSCGGGGAAVPSVDEVLQRLAAAQNQSAMESAVHTVLDKTGLGRSVTGSSYSDLTVSDQEVRDWASLELTTTNPDGWPTIQSLHDSLVNFLPEPLVADLPTILVELQRQANGAFALTPEEPDSALLVIMLSSAPRPSTAPVVTGQTRLSPVRALLFSAWIVRQFATSTRADSRFSLTWCLRWCQIKYDFNVAKCIAIAAVKIGAITIAAGLTIASIPTTWPALAAILAGTTLSAAAILEIKAIFDAMLDCLKKAKDSYDACVAKCHQQGGVRTASPLNTSVPAPACCGG